MNAFDNEDFAEACRADFLVFAEAAWPIVNPGKRFVVAPHVEAITHVLECTERGEMKRLAITLPPRYGKSFLASIAFPAWLLGRDPSKQIICISYAEDLASQHASDCKALMDSPFYKEIFQGTRIDRKHSAPMDFMTVGARGRRIATTVGGTLTGRGQFIIVDDPMKPQDAFSERRRKTTHEWWSNTLVQRLDSKQDDVIITVMQRIHPDDNIARLRAKGNVEFLNLPAIAIQDEEIPLSHGRVFRRRAGEALDNEREPLRVLEELRNEIGPGVFEAQYQQNPAANDNAMVPWERIARYGEEKRKQLLRSREDYYVISWDTAVKTGDKNDYSVGTVWFVEESFMPPGSQCLDKSRFYLVDVVRARLDFISLAARMSDLRNQYRPRYMFIEDSHLGPALKEELDTGYDIEVDLIRPRGDKASRFYAQQGWFERQQVLFPKEAPWLETLKDEMQAFPHGAHDDQVDSISQFLFWVFDTSRRRFQVHQV